MHLKMGVPRRSAALMSESCPCCSAPAKHLHIFKQKVDTRNLQNQKLQ